MKILFKNGHRYSINWFWEDRNYFGRWDMYHTDIIPNKSDIDPHLIVGWHFKIFSLGPLSFRHYWPDRMPKDCVPSEFYCGVMERMSRHGITHDDYRSHCETR